MDANSHNTYHYVAIGDSLTVGLGSDIFSPGFALRYADEAAKALHHPIFIDKFARSGATSGEILEALYIPAVCEAIGSSDIITITAGGNDLIDAAEVFLIDQDETKLFFAMENAIKNIKAMVERIHFLHNPAHHLYILRLLNLYNPLPNIPQADRWIRIYNEQLNEHTRFSHIKIADVYSSFKGRQAELLHDIHPNNRGYEVIAKTLNSLGYAPLG